MAPLSLASAGSPPHASTSYGADSLLQPRFKSKRSAGIGAASCLAAVGLLYHSFGQDARLDYPWTVCTSPAHGGGRAICRSSPSPPPVDALQTYITRALQPGEVTPVFIPGSIPVLMDDVYRMPGYNFDLAPSGSTRLHRLPMLSEYRDPEHGFRFPANPSITPHPSRAGIYLLSTQITAYWFTRRLDGVEYNPQSYGYNVRHVGADLEVIEHPPGHFEFKVTNTGPLDSFLSIDMRMMSYRNATLAYPGTLNHGVVVINATVGGTGPAYPQLAGPSRLRFHDPTSSANKNWQGVMVGDDVFWMSHFSPLTILDCGAPRKQEGDAECHKHAYHSMEGSLLPPEAVHWRGSHPFLPLPGFLRYLLSTTHQRADEVHEPSANKANIRDFYTHYFVILEADTLMPFAYSAPFTILGDVNTTGWFEFVAGGTYLGSCDIMLTFGFNDQEPWLAILELAPILASLLPTFETKRAALSSLQHQFSGQNNC